MSIVRKPAAAGRFYPNDPDALRAALRGYLQDAVQLEVRPKGIIVPHAGYVYSGPIAAAGYAQLKPLRGVVNRVVLLGPAHFVPLRGLAASTASEFETPLGPVPVDTQAIARLLRFPQVQVLDAAHTQEHSLEVHLPFLQEVLDEFQVVPLLVGLASVDEVAEVIDSLWDDPGTFFVVSSDLSHFHDYEQASCIDRETSRAIESLKYEELDGQHACGYLPIGGLLRAARRSGCSVKTLDLRNSGDTSGDRSRVVGYGAWLVDASDPLENISVEHEQTLLQTAGESIRSGLDFQKPLDVDHTRYPSLLQIERATFVTLLIDGQLRGCMGSLAAEEPLICNVARNGFSAAFRDPRFSPLSPGEFDQLELHISILGPRERMVFESESDLLERIRPGIDGLILCDGKRRGTLLPSVWEHVSSTREFLEHLKQKASLPADYWSETLTVERYTALSVPTDVQ